MLAKRIQLRNNYSPKIGPVIYWMSRDQRVQDNWGLIYAQTEAAAMNQPLYVIFSIAEEFLGASQVHYSFMATGLMEVRNDLRGLGIPFLVLSGNPWITIPDLITQLEAGVLISDFHVLREVREWKDKVNDNIEISFQEIDAHNIIPVWEASAKAEYGAYTLRPKMKRLLPDYLTEIPSLERHRFSPRTDETELEAKELQTDRILNSMILQGKTESGSSFAHQKLKGFIKNRLPVYHQRNDPIVEATSGLSPYIHFGQISTQRIALEVLKANSSNREEFLEELIVRRELADNFCYYNPYYDSVLGFPNWAQKTLNEHRHDLRDYVYDYDELEKAKTHDPLWNAAQSHMVFSGSMPGYLRMYWAKKILEWSLSPESALEICIHFNNLYQLDGRDPNGYAGIAWSVGGVHDRAWAEREVFGKIRYMSFAGSMRKFDVRGYIDKVVALTGEPVRGHLLDKKKKI